MLSFGLLYHCRIIYWYYFGSYILLNYREGPELRGSIVRRSLQDPHILRASAQNLQVVENMKLSIYASIFNTKLSERKC